ncbi:hypothetical protein ACP70R_017759 [Stipagrostis hirtigluma subsp. patula]
MAPGERERSGVERLSFLLRLPSRSHTPPLPSSPTRSGGGGGRVCRISRGQDRHCRGRRISRSASSEVKKAAPSPKKPLGAGGRRRKRNVPAHAPIHRHPRIPPPQSCSRRRRHTHVLALQPLLLPLPQIQLSLSTKSLLRSAPPPAHPICSSPYLSPRKLLWI